MYELMILLFVVGYAAIAFEHPLKIDKAASALLTAVLTWTAFVLGKEVILANSEAVAEFIAQFPQFADDPLNHFIDHELTHHLNDIARIIFFLLGAMTVVELIDAHEGFAVITDKIETADKVKLLWIIGLLSFFLSAALDNLTTAIVMSALLKKLVKSREDLMVYAGVVIIAANAGGAWSPIGDVTTIMLWIGGQVTAFNIIIKLIVPSIVCLLVPLTILSFTMKGEVKRKLGMVEKHHLLNPTTALQRNTVFFVGVGLLLFVPIFKSITHLPPFLGILFALGALWVLTELMHKKKKTEEKASLSVIGVLQKIDTPSVLFFLGILLAVGSLQSAGHLEVLATWLSDIFDGNMYSINLTIGLLSAIVDNVPLVAGAMGMYPMTTYGPDDPFWEFLAYCAGTGGSCLIIGSAAGVAVMGILRIDFLWYLKKMSLLALAGYLAGALTYYLMY